MALTLGDNFSYQGAKPLDARLTYSTLADMKAVADATMYNGCLAYCVATDKTYQWKSTNTVDEDTGRWREFETGGGGGTSDYSDLTNKPQINNVELSGNKTASDLGLAPSTVADTCYKTGDSAFTAIADGDYVPVYDTSASAKKRTLWSNIKSVLKTYFDTLYADIGTGLTKSDNTLKIKEFASGDMDEVISELPQGNTLVSIANAFNKGDIYSTSEKMIGQWQDGKPLYQKTINFGALPNATSKSKAHGVSNIGTVVSATGFASSNSNYYMIPNISTNTVGGNVSIIVDTTNITLTTGTNYSSINCYIILKYTKSTDSAVSIGEETEYSTSEKIVGTWIDGKPIYQKTITGYNLPSAIVDGTYANTNIPYPSGFDRLISLDGVVKNPSGINACSINGGVDSNGTGYPIIAFVGSSNIVVGANKASLSGFEIVLTIQYTKA